MTARRIAHVDHIAQSVGWMVDAAVLQIQAARGAVGFWLRAYSETALWRKGLSCDRRDVPCSRIFGRSRGRLRSNSQFFEQRILPSRDEADLQPAEDVVHYRLGDRDLRVTGKARGIEAGGLEFVA